MFEHIIGQENIVQLLSNDITNNSLTNSMIFTGYKYSGKLTTALEFTRIINCLDDRGLNCNCNNCRRINDLNFEGLILLSRRSYTNFLTELISCYNKSNNKKYFDKIKYIIKLISLPLHDFLIQNSVNEQDKKELSATLEQLNDIINKEELSGTDSEKILKLDEKIQDKYKKLNIPIDTIRSMINWTYISQPDIKRVVIIDHIEHLEKASQNILLKRLEEPSLNLYFILLTGNINNIVKTILSRCRIYYFKKLNETDVKTIIKNDFDEDVHEYKSINDFIIRSDEKASINLLPLIIKLFNLTFLKENPFSELSLFLSNFNEKKYVKAMLHEIINLLDKELSIRELGLNNETDFKMLKYLSNFTLEQFKILILKKYNDIDKFGLNPTLLLEGIFYPLKAILNNDKIKFS